MSRRPTIAVVAPRAPGDGLGGAEEHLLELGVVLSSLGADIRFLSARDAPPPNMVERCLGRMIPLLHTPLASRRMASAGFFRDVDVVLTVELMGFGVHHARHLHLFFGSYTGFRRAALLPARGIRRAHRALLNLLARALENASQGKDGAVANSRGLRDTLRASGIRIRHEVIVPPTNMERFSPRERTGARERLGIPCGPRVLLFVGRWEYAKGADRVAQVLEALPPEWILVAACPSGETWRWPSHPRAMRLLDVPRNVMPDVYAAADILIQPSRFEGYSLVVSEAQSCGCPVVTATTGHAAHLMNGPDPIRSGVVFDPDDPAAWVAAIMRVAGDDDRHFVSSQAARSFVARECAREVVAVQWRSLLGSLYPEFAWSLVR